MGIRDCEWGERGEKEDEWGVRECEWGESEWRESA